MLPPAAALHGPARHHQPGGLLLPDSLLHDDPQVPAVNPRNTPVCCYATVLDRFFSFFSNKTIKMVD